MTNSNNLSSSLQNCLTLKELCSELSISVATGQNWLKLGKITPQYTDNSKNYFTDAYVKNLKESITSGQNNALKSRRNKKFISGNSLYNSYVSSTSLNLQTVQLLLSNISRYKIQLNSSIVQLLIADCALHFFVQKMQKNELNDSNLLLQFLNKKFSVNEYDELIYDLIDDTEFAIEFCEKNRILFNNSYIYEPNEDILGLIYISCNNLADRKSAGSYYTPTSIVKKLIDKLSFTNNSTILDPCCGTGNFLIQLPNNISFNEIYGNDLDTISVKTTRLNMALKFNPPVKTLYEHITNCNYLTDFKDAQFDYIIGNPPWGYDFSDNEKKELKNLFNSAQTKNIESYCVVIEQSLKHLNKNGHLCFVLPEAILNIKYHSKIREIILNNCSIKHLEFLGDVFDGVSCPSIILDLIYTKCPLSTLGMCVNTKKESFTIHTEREVSAYNFSFTITDEEYNVINKIKNINCTYLLDNAEFGLGIVTGNNLEYISDTKNKNNEMILRGSDIFKYNFKPSNDYIIFKPDSFQQVAPTNIYRAPEKLIYRFICNQLVFAYDDKQTLSLNSANILIPKIPSLKIKYILAILNSRCAQFIFKREFKSVKVLRSHIENIPIPLVDENTQNEIIELVNKLMTSTTNEEISTLYEQLDIDILKIYKLDDNDYQIIKNAIDHENKFLF